jgi:hypothetical protein
MQLVKGPGSGTDSGARSDARRAADRAPPCMRWRGPDGPSALARRLPGCRTPRDPHRHRAPGARVGSPTRPPFRMSLPAGPASVVTAVLLPIAGPAQGAAGANFGVFPLSTGLSTARGRLSPGSAGLSAAPSTGRRPGPSPQPRLWPAVSALAGRLGSGRRLRLWPAVSALAGRLGCQRPSLMAMDTRPWSAVSALVGGFGPPRLWSAASVSPRLQPAGPARPGSRS